ncbi:MAG: hypothetical protein C6P37_08490 [Caldibacillus debilis]|uniref:YtkA-like domain-containing protein n=1 Tax=Caldibacillus debilis TaxID=301148 RepID=A0A3E0K4N6_9BACI|nr:FixH family protein [Caldibacillus debilis]OUM92291.1 MAG: hypothetical protein BAA03_11965 [Caldibacillus debilis]REJ16472.1 MAG: hypothetical protein C6W57_08190 [Caldibacillus debilis]REJ28667.1 MAG: hypothetical protein C6P37_08490 [Caldibacillus debilis]REJ28719.1 MAG: hypothetical protein C6W56_07670 [Caldibacillus debilis]
MKKFAGIMAVLLAILFLGACGKEEEGHDGDRGEMIDVALEVPEKSDPGEKVELRAVVTQGKEKVKDADEVKFEIWKEGAKDDSSMLDAKNNGDGSYTAETTFAADGVYTVQVHVTARGMHTMPKKNITVGSGETGEAGHQGHEGDEGQVAIHLMKEDPITAGKETALTVHVQKDGAPLEKAKVTLEIAGTGASQKEMVPAAEAAKGAYKASYTFPEKGNYRITIHVEKEEGKLHTHQEEEVAVR